MNFLATDLTPFRVLDSVIGWQANDQHGIVEFGAEGDLRLQPLPGTAGLFFSGSPGGMKCPVAAGLDECGVLFVLDAAADRVWRIRTDTGEATVVREFGGKGVDARRLKAPRGLALLPRGGFAVCDTNNHRAQVFSTPPCALTQLWGAAENQPGNAPLQFSYPWGATYGPDGFLYIADRGNARLQRVRPDGTDWSELGVGSLVSPTEIAISPEGLVAVCDAAPGAAKILVFSPGNSTPQTLAAGQEPLSVVFDLAGNLYAGTLNGLVFVWTPDLKLAGAGVSGLDSAIRGLAWIGTDTLLAIVDEEDVTPRQRLWIIPTAGAFVASGSLLTAPLDSRIENCAWHRIQVKGSVPAGTALRIETVTTADTNPPVAGWQTALLSPPAVPSEQLQALLGENTTPATPNETNEDPDGLVQNGPGRFLRLRITMVSSVAASPVIHAIRIYYPRESYLRYLPANFQEDEQSRNFLSRFLSVFQTAFDSFDRRIDAMWRLFDPLSAPETWFNWLAAWMALPVDPGWDLAKKRQMLKGAAAQYLVRGTVAGLQQSVADYAGVQGTILEHYKLRRWPLLLNSAAQQATTSSSMTQYDARLCAATPLWSRAFAARLQVGKYAQVGAFELRGSGSPATDAFTWGAAEFTVFFAADPYRAGASTGKVQQVVEREKPAHTRAFYVPVYPRMRVGVQASLGVDTYVSRITYTALNCVATLGYDAVLGQSRVRKQVAVLGTSQPPLAGLTTRLL